MARSNKLVKAGLLLAVLAVVGFLFWRSVNDARAEPYTVDREHLRGWSIALRPDSGAAGPLLLLRPPQGLGGALFRQVFTRSMESLVAPQAEGIPLLLRTEFDRAFAGTTPNALMALARSEGVESLTLQPRCLAHRRKNVPGATRQVFFLIFDAPEVLRLRERLGTQAQPGEFDPAALSPVMFIASSDPAFNDWLPIRTDPAADCLAPIAAN